MKLSANIALIQGIYYLVVGLWPVIDIDSFMAVTGPKLDIWLMNVVGLFMAVVGVTLLHARQKVNINSSIVLLGTLTATIMAILEIYYVSQDIIWSIYLLDVTIEVIILFLWLLSMYLRRVPERRPVKPV